MDAWSDIHLDIVNNRFQFDGGRAPQAFAFGFYSQITPDRAERPAAAPAESCSGKYELVLLMSRDHALAKNIPLPRRCSNPASCISQCQSAWMCLRISSFRRLLTCCHERLASSGGDVAEIALAGAVCALRQKWLAEEYAQDMPIYHALGQRRHSKCLASAAPEGTSERHSNPLQVFIGKLPKATALTTDSTMVKNRGGLRHLHRTQSYIYTDEGFVFLTYCWDYMEVDRVLCWCAIARQSKVFRRSPRKRLRGAEPALSETSVNCRRADIVAAWRSHGFDH
ncbi:MAG: hypothetical protein ACYYK0_05700 [Candidatus Eutrophobiaceae bacterium]